MSGKTLAPSELAKFIDHTLLKPEATSDDIAKLCSEALTFGFKGVCVQTGHLPQIEKLLRSSKTLPVCVVGFPLGAESREVKIYETKWAVDHGAQEIDMVIRLGHLKAGEDHLAQDDIASVVEAAQGKPVKVIIETGLLTKEEVIRACLISEKAGAKFVKTATGFLGRGATVEDIQLIRKTVSHNIEIKASGGVKTLEIALQMIEAGATRIGTSSGVALVTGLTATTNY